VVVDHDGSITSVEQRCRDFPPAHHENKGVLANGAYGDPGHVACGDLLGVRGQALNPPAAEFWGQNEEVLAQKLPTGRGEGRDNVPQDLRTVGQHKHRLSAPEPGTATGRSQALGQHAGDG
jgi:hypothetical protein